MSGDLTPAEQAVGQALERVVVRERLAAGEPYTRDHARDLVTKLRPLLAAEAAPAAVGDLGDVIQSALDHVVAAKTAAQAVLSRAPELDNAKRLLLRARTLAGQGAVPDIVTGEQARDLPPGSRVVLAEDDGQAAVGCRVRQIGFLDPSDSAEDHYLVLHRAPAPAPKVGDVVTTEAELSALPVGAVVRAVWGMRVTYERLHNDDWHAAGDRGAKAPHEMLRYGGVRVLDFGGDS